MEKIFTTKFPVKICIWNSVYAIVSLKLLKKRTQSHRIGLELCPQMLTEAHWVVGVGLSFISSLCFSMFSQPYFLTRKILKITTVKRSSSALMANTKQGAPGKDSPTSPISGYKRCWSQRTWAPALWRVLSVTRSDSLIFKIIMIWRSLVISSSFSIAKEIEDFHCQRQWPIPVLSPVNDCFQENILCRPVMGECWMVLFTSRGVALI